MTEHFRNACVLAEFESDLKLVRGYDAVYDPIIDTLGTDTNVLELGVGGGGSHARWTYAVQGKVIGLEIAGPDFEKCSGSAFTGDPNIVQRQVDLAQLAANELFPALPDVNSNRLDIRFYHDAFDPANAALVYADYPDLSFVINDSKHAPHLWRLMEETWVPGLPEGGIIVQEEIGRYVNSRDPSVPDFEETMWSEVKLALEAGWRVFQFIDKQNFTQTDKYSDDAEYHYRANVIGVRYKDTELWADKFDHLQEREVTLDNWARWLAQSENKNK